MPNFKQNWFDIMCKCVMAIISVLLAYNQIQTNSDHKKFEQILQTCHVHTDYLEDTTDEED